MRLSKLFENAETRPLFQKLATEFMAAIEYPRWHENHGYSPKKDTLSLSQRMDSLRKVRPVARTHSHNDEAHQVPLFDALSNGFVSIEVDIFAAQEKLLVGHSVLELTNERTLESLYLDPLLELTLRNKGNVYSESGQSLQLIIDLKQISESAHKALHETLKRYDSMLTSYKDGKKHEGAVTVIVTGYRPDEASIKSEPVRYMAYDGHVKERGNGMDPNVVPLISGSGGLSWSGEGPMPERERQRLKSIVDTAHANGQRVRFWSEAEGSRPAARAAQWKEMLDANVDYIHTDYLPELREWLLKNDPTLQMKPAQKKKPQRRPPAP